MSTTQDVLNRIERVQFKPYKYLIERWLKNNTGESFFCDNSPDKARIYVDTLGRNEKHDYKCEILLQPILLTIYMIYFFNFVVEESRRRKYSFKIEMYNNFI